MKSDNQCNILQDKAGSIKANLLFYILLFIAITVLCLGIYQYVRFFNFGTGIQYKAKIKAQEEVITVSGKLDAKMQEIEVVSRQLSDETSNNRLDKKRIFTRLDHIISLHKRVTGIGIVYMPYRYNSGIKLFAPYCIKKDNSLKHVQIESLYDYTPQDYYKLPIKGNKGEWIEPHFGKATNDFLTDYSIPFYRISPVTGKREIAGVVMVTCSLDEIGKIMKSLDMGATGYSYLLSSEGRYIFNPDTNLVKNGITIFQEAKKLKNRQLKITGKKVLEKKRAILESGASWTFIEPVHSTGWSLVSVFYKREILNRYLATEHKYVLKITACITISLLFFTLLMLCRKYTDKKNIWKCSTVISLVFLFSTSFLYYYELNNVFYKSRIFTPVYNRTELNKYIQNIKADCVGKHKSPPAIVPTGIFVNSAEFVSSNNINMTGYIWQKCQKKDTACLNSSIIFPEATDLILEKKSASEKNREITTIWNFKVSLRENFDYKKYPFDSQDSWIRMKAGNFNGSVLLVPDFDSYELISGLAKPGVNPSIVWPGYFIKRSFFSYSRNLYNTNLGLDNEYNDQIPELYFTILSKRNFIDPFITNIFPVSVVSIIIFAVIMMMSTHTHKDNNNFDMTPTNVILTASSLFFAVLIAHTNLRTVFSVPEIIYIEYYFFIMYLIILIVCLNSYLLAWKNIPLIQYENNIFMKALYWPLFSGLILAVTFFSFYYN